MLLVHWNGICRMGWDSGLQICPVCVVCYFTSGLQECSGLGYRHYMLTAQQVLHVGAQRLGVVMRGPRNKIDGPLFR